MAEEDEITIETREELVDFLNSTKYENVIIKFYASWCKPCEKIAPFVEKCIDELTTKFQGNSNKFVFLELDVDESFDLYAFLKQKKMVRGIPTIFLYSKNVYKSYDKDKKYIPQACISGTNEEEIKKVFNIIS
tara:strand:+ start:139 stop:537 length:399 start_codon:yes stop_codon:yes gene_type:complete